MKRAIVWTIVVLATVFSGIGLRPLLAASTDKKASTAKFEVYKDKAGDYRWRLRTQNKQVIASSGEGYSSKQSCLDGIESVKKNAADAAVEEVEQKPAEKGE
jgi:uncharacterized protein YegP (UPF0339 family)